MGRTSKWGDGVFRKGIIDDEKAKADILSKLKDLGETGFEDKANVQKPDVIHSMNPSWQRYSATSFGKVVRQCRAILSKSFF